MPCLKFLVAYSFCVTDSLESYFPSRPSLDEGKNKGVLARSVWCASRRCRALFGMGGCRQGSVSQTRCIMEELWRERVNTAAIPLFLKAGFVCVTKYQWLDWRAVFTVMFHRAERHHEPIKDRRKPAFRLNGPLYM